MNGRETRMRVVLKLMCAWCLIAVPAGAEPPTLTPVRIANPGGGHIHPAVCRTQRGTLVVTYGQVNHRDLRITRSTDGGLTWSSPVPYPPTIGKTYYPGSLTTLQNGQILHAWNRWSADDNEREPRSVIYSLSNDDGETWSDPQPFPRNSTTRPCSSIPQPANLNRLAMVAIMGWFRSSAHHGGRSSAEQGCARPIPANPGNRSMTSPISKNRAGDMNW
ncbi:MAG: hypothetical protein B7Z55_19460 [Planctomycetales bacterium 12-60-4]|nr:MAG: hypothetical protein B7Z55_19460 [Planctomycetales bacterium 12-60-4]